MRAVIDTNVLVSGLLWHGAPHALLDEVRLLAEMIEPPLLSQPVCRDPADDAVLALAIVAQVDLIVSGDGDLLTLASYADIPILTPAQAVQMIGG